MAVALDVVRGDRTPSQVAGDHGVAPSLACEWRDQLVGSAADVFGKARPERERKRAEEAARREHDDAVRKIGQPTLERDFLQRFLDERGHGPGSAGRRQERHALRAQGALRGLERGGTRSGRGGSTRRTSTTPSTARGSSPAPSRAPARRRRAGRRAT